MLNPQNHQVFFYKIHGKIVIHRRCSTGTYLYCSNCQCQQCVGLGNHLKDVKKTTPKFTRKCLEANPSCQKVILRNRIDNFLVTESRVLSNWINYSFKCLFLFFCLFPNWINQKTFLFTRLGNLLKFFFFLLLLFSLNSPNN